MQNQLIFPITVETRLLKHIKKGKNISLFFSEFEKHQANLLSLHEDYIFYLPIIQPCQIFNCHEL